MLVTFRTRNNARPHQYAAAMTVFIETFPSIWQKQSSPAQYVIHKIRYTYTNTSVNHHVLVSLDQHVTRLIMRIVVYHLCRLRCLFLR